MRKYFAKYFEVYLLVAVIGFIVFFKIQQKDTKPYVILVSFDGFRHDYVEKFNAPNFKAFMTQGISAEAMLPSYPSKTFPNHYTIVTGLYPGHHGLVDNNFYDPVLDMEYGVSKREAVENPVFYGGLPLWQLVQRNGMKSASYFWVGSEAPVAGSFPDYYHIYDGSVPNEKRINGVIDWLNLPEKDRPHFISLYFSLVDTQGHAFGPNSAKTKEAVLEADRLLGLLVAQVDALKMPVNIVLVSDHGMNEIQPKVENYFTVSELLNGLDTSRFRFVNNGTHGHFYTEDKDYLKEIASTLKTKPGSQHFKVFFKDEIPTHWHYSQHYRVGDLFIKMNPGYYLTSSAKKQSIIQNKQVRGEHGFDANETVDMGGIFYAKGPAFKSGLKIKKFSNVHIYPLIAQILKIRKLPKIDGKLEVLSPFLKE